METSITIKTERVIQACKEYLNRRDRNIEAKLEKFREKYRKKLKYIFFGDTIEASTVEKIIEGKHWFYGQGVLFFTYADSIREYVENVGIYWAGCVEGIKEAAEKSDGELMQLTVDDFSIIGKYL